MRPHHLRDFPPAASDDQLIQRITAILAGMPRPMVADILIFLEFWLKLPGRARAVLAACVQPGLTEEALARLAGLTVGTLKRNRLYQMVRVRLEDYLETKQRTFYLPPEPDDFTV